MCFFSKKYMVFSKKKSRGFSQPCRSSSFLRRGRERRKIRRTNQVVRSSVPTKMAGKHFGPIVRFCTKCARVTAESPKITGKVQNSAEYWTPTRVCTFFSLFSHFFQIFEKTEKTEIEKKVHFFFFCLLIDV